MLHCWHNLIRFFMNLDFICKSWCMNMEISVYVFSASSNVSVVAS